MRAFRVLWVSNDTYGQNEEIVSANTPDSALAKVKGAYGNLTGFRTLGAAQPLNEYGYRHVAPRITPDTFKDILIVIGGLIILFMIAI